MIRRSEKDEDDGRGVEIQMTAIHSIHNNQECSLVFLEMKGRERKAKERSSG